MVIHRKDECLWRTGCIFTPLTPFNAALLLFFTPTALGLSGSLDELLPLMPWVHDARLPLGEASGSQRAGESAARATAVGALMVDYHAFHCETSAGVAAKKQKKKREEEASKQGVKQ